jgi:hypothetical protein
MSSPVAKAICLIHSDRPAVARCPSCREFFCGECVTEHSGKFICAACLVKGSAGHRSVKKKASLAGVAAVIQLLLALALCWGLYYSAGRFLSEIPDEFHDGTIWE